MGARPPPSAGSALPPSAPRSGSGADARGASGFRPAEDRTVPTSQLTAGKVPENNWLLYFPTRAPGKTTVCERRMREAGLPGEPRKTQKRTAKTQPISSRCFRDPPTPRL